MRFVFRPVLTIFALAAIGVLVALGTWQLQRLSWKLDLIEKIEARVELAPQDFDVVYANWSVDKDQEYTPVSLTGTFLHDKEVHVFGTNDGKPGWFVITPLVRGDKPLVYINRGFVSIDKKEADKRVAGQVMEEVTITGLFRAPAKVPFFAGLVQPADNPDTNEWHQRNASVFAEAAGLTAAAVIVDAARSELTEPLGGTTQLAFRNKHFEYALTWFGLAVALAGVFLAFSMKRIPAQSS